MECSNNKACIDSLERINRRSDDCCTFTKHPNPHKILLECGTRPQDAIFDIDRRGRGRRDRDQEFILDRVIVDTSCLCRPQVKIDFSCIIFFEAETERSRRGYDGEYSHESDNDEEYRESDNDEEYRESDNNEEYRESDDETEAEAEIQHRKEEFEVDLEFELIRVCHGVEECVQKWRYLKEFEIKNCELEVEISESFCVTFCDRECPGCCAYKMKVTLEDLDGDFDALRVTSPCISVLAQGICGD